MSVEPGIDVAKILIDVVFNVIAKLSKNDVFGFVKSDKLSVLVKTSFFLKGLNIGLEYAFSSI